MLICDFVLFAMLQRTRVINFLLLLFSAVDVYWHYLSSSFFFELSLYEMRVKYDKYSIYIYTINEEITKRKKITSQQHYNIKNLHIYRSSFSYYHLPYSQGNFIIIFLICGTRSRVQQIHLINSMYINWKMLCRKIRE